MIYAANIKTEHPRAKTNLKHTVLRVTRGLVYKVEFYFPPGSSGLMGVAVFDGLFQLWPSNIGEFFRGSDISIDFDDLYLKEAAPYQFDIYTYNLDDAYDHTVDVRIGLVSKDVFMARFLPTKGYDYLMEMTAKLQVEQASRAAAQAELTRETPYEWLLRQLEGTE